MPGTHCQLKCVTSCTENVQLLTVHKNKSVACVDGDMSQRTTTVLSSVRDILLYA